MYLIDGMVPDDFCQLFASQEGRLREDLCLRCLQSAFSLLSI